MSGASARLSRLHTPVETGTPPYITGANCTHSASANQPAAFRKSFVSFRCASAFHPKRYAGFVRNLEIVWQSRHRLHSHWFVRCPWGNVVLMGICWWDHTGDCSTLPGGSVLQFHEILCVGPQISGSQARDRSRPGCPPGRRRSSGPAWACRSSCSAGRGKCRWRCPDPR